MSRQMSVSNLFRELYVHSLPYQTHADGFTLLSPVEVTIERPYRELNFLVTYLNGGLGAMSSFGGFVMPVTSLALINQSIGACDGPPEILHGS